MTLRELYQKEDNIRDYEIPEEWRDNFNKFMIGQTCLVYEKEDGSRGFEYYYQDFINWFFLNKKAIERNEKIDDILKT